MTITNHYTRPYILPTLSKIGGSRWALLEGVAPPDCFWTVTGDSYSNLFRNAGYNWFSLCQRLSECLSEIQREARRGFHGSGWRSQSSDWWWFYHRYDNSSLLLATKCLKQMTPLWQAVRGYQVFREVGTIPAENTPKVQQIGWMWQFRPNQGNLTVFTKTWKKTWQKPKNCRKSPKVTPKIGRLPKIWRTPLHEGPPTRRTPLHPFARRSPNPAHPFAPLCTKVARRLGGFLPPNSQFWKEKPLFPIFASFKLFLLLMGSWCVFLAETFLPGWFHGSFQKTKRRKPGSNSVGQGSAPQKQGRFGARGAGF